MRVWVAVGWWDYDGYDEPIGVFSTEELARDALAKNATNYDGKGVYECELDTPGSTWKPGDHPGDQQGVSMSDKIDQLAEAADKFLERHPRGISPGKLNCTHDFRSVFPAYSECHICGLKLGDPALWPVPRS